MNVTFDVTGTRAFVAKTLRRYVQGPVAVIGSLGLLVTLLVRGFDQHNIAQVVVAIALLFFAGVILRDFIAEKLENDEQKPLSRKNAACLLSFDILRFMLGRTPRSAFPLLEAAAHSERGKFILSEMDLEPKKLLSLAKPILDNVTIIDFLAESTQVMREINVRKIGAGTILYTFFRQNGLAVKLLNELDISLHDLEMIVRWEQFRAKMWHHTPFFSPAGLVRAFGGVGRDWVMGYNDTLDLITEDISQTILYRGKRCVTIHLEQLQDALHVLNRSAQHNLIVTGDHGSGKTSFIENIAYMLRSNESSHGLAYTRVLVLNAQDLLSGSQNPDTFLLEALKRSSKQGNFVLVIEDIGLFLQASDTNVQSVLSKFLQSKSINVIGVAHTRDYHTLIKTNPTLDAQFEKIGLEPTSFSDTMSVLMEEYFRIKDCEHVNVTYKALRSIVDLADQYLTKGAFPGKAIDLLRDAVLAAKKGGDDTVSEEHIERMVSLKAHMDVGKVQDEERDTLLSLADQMSERIIGQRYAIDAISNALKRARANVSSRKRPIGTFLFLGPTGVGKTETAKALADAYFGEEGNMIRLNMNEFSTEDSVQGIVGSTTPGVVAEGFITQQVQDKPFSLLLLDEIEKAHPKVLNLFLQVLDEGELIDAHGQRTDFRNTIIIATSNAGALFIQSFLKEHPDPDREVFKKALVEEVLKQGAYSPEFLNRFDDVVLYFPLTKEETVRVAESMINGVITEMEETKGIAIQVDHDAVEAIAMKGYSPEFGAREMRRAVTDTLENYVADYILQNEVKRGDTIAVTREDLSL